MIKKLITSIIAIALLVLLALSLLLTPGGLRFSVFLANHATSYHIQYQKISGTILGPLTINDFKYQHNNINISIKKISLDWSFTKYLNNEIDIKNLTANHTIVTLLKNEQKIKPFRLPSLPKNIHIQQLQLNDIQVNNSKRNLLQSTNLDGHITINKSIIDALISISSNQPMPWKSKIILSGTPKKAQIKATLQANHKTWSLNGEKIENKIHFNTNNNQFLSGTLTATGTLTLQPLGWYTTIRASHLDLYKINLNLPKLINFNIHSQGTISSDNKIKTVSSINAQNDHNQIKININTTDQLGINWNIQCTQLSRLSSLFAGDLQSKGSARMANNTIQSNGTLASKNITSNTFNATDLHSKWQFQNNNKKQSELHVTASQAHYNTFDFKKAYINLNGTPQHHKLEFTSDINGFNSKITLSGQASEQSWNSQISTLSLQNKTISLRNKKSIKLGIQNNAITLPPFCLYNGITPSLCLNFNLSSSHYWNSSIQATNFPYQLLNPFLPNNFRGAANIDLRGKIDGLKKQIKNASATLRINRLSLSKLHTNISNKIDYITSTLKFKHNTLASSNTIEIDKNNSISANVNIANLFKSNNTKKSISGSMVAKINDIAILNNLFPTVSILGGKLQSNIALSGTLSQPNLAGTANLTAGMIYSPELGLMLKNISTTIRGNHKTLNTHTIVNIQSKPLLINSTTKLHSPTYETQGTIKGNNVLLYNLPQYIVYGSPDLKFTADTKSISLYGNITVPKAIIKPIQSFNAITLPAEDIIYTNASENLLSHYPYAFNIYATLEKNITINIHGIKGRVSGKLDLKKKINHPIFANGDISVVNGTYQIYGNQLTIAKNSALLFPNTLITQPNLSISASKTIQPSSASFNQGLSNGDITVGIKVTGTIKKPNLALYSVPATLSQAQILSYLILGYSIETNANQSSQNQNLFNALNALKLAQSSLSSSHGAGLINSIRSTLGLSELNINSQTTSDALGNTIDNTPHTSFVIGKYITKNIYLKYIQDLSALNPLRVVQAILFLSPQWSIQASTSISSDKTNTPSQISSNNYYNGIDLMYTLNRKK